MTIEIVSLISSLKRERRKAGPRTQFSELTIRDEQSAQSSQSLKGIIFVSCRSVLGQWRIWGLEALGLILCSLPNEVLNQIAVILGQ